MKVLFENWRKSLKNIGKTFPTITKLDVIENPARNVHQKNALLNMFGTLQRATNTNPEDGVTIQNILTAIYNYSGNSEEFKYKSKEEALRDYVEPYKYEDKSLKDHHKRIQNIINDLTRHKLRI